MQKPRLCVEDNGVNQKKILYPDPDSFLFILMALSLEVARALAKLFYLTSYKS